MGKTEPWNNFIKKTLKFDEKPLVSVRRDYTYMQIKPMIKTLDISIIRTKRLQKIFADFTTDSKLTEPLKKPNEVEKKTSHLVGPTVNLLMAFG
jgi:hypothetical protein